MRILWVKTDFLHPTTRGGQIRSLEMLRRLHERHEVHYLALDDGRHPEGPARAGEYSAWHEAIPHRAPDKRSLAFLGQLATGLVSPVPVAVSRWRSRAMTERVSELMAGGRYDSIVCDFLFPAVNIPDLSHVVLFQHNVEATIWRRRAEHGATPAHRAYYALQARRMAALEGRVCREVRRVIAVSRDDSERMEHEYGSGPVPHVATGVDVEYFAPPAEPAPASDIVFLGSMDWMPNVDGAEWFASEVLPRIRARHPACTVALVGRNPAPAVRALGQGATGIEVTDTVPDVRPWLHGARVSIVPLRIGGGTRLKIYEAMAAGVPVVSTSVGAEGLDVTHEETILLADSPEAFADACIALLDDEATRRRVAAAATSMVARRCSWEAVVEEFEELIAP